jgi:hypothetical protein
MAAHLPRRSAHDDALVGEDAGAGSGAPASTVPTPVTGALFCSAVESAAISSPSSPGDTAPEGVVLATRRCIGESGSFTASPHKRRIAFASTATTNHKRSQHDTARKHRRRQRQGHREGACVTATTESSSADMYAWAS